MHRKSLFVAIASCLVGLVLWIDDDLLLMLGQDAPATLVRRICGVLEFFFMVPGAAVLGWILSERFRRSKELLAQIEAHARRDRLVALGRVAAGLAHEIRNPLHNLRLILDELHHIDSAAEGEQLKGRVNANMARIDHAVELVYRLARPRAAAAADETCDLGGVIAESVAAERIRTPAVQLRCAGVPQARIGCTSAAGGADPCRHPCPGPERAMVGCAGDDVRMALDNLLRNATAAADQSGVRIDLRCAGDAWEIVVVNQGELPAWVRAEDDSRAASTKPGGLGLGLSISRQIIAEAGGTLSLSQVGRSVEARLCLPRIEETAA